MAIKPKKNLQERFFLAESMRHYLLTGEYGAQTYPDCPGQGETFLLANPGRRDELQKVWLRHRSQLMAEWLKQKLCSRPWAWWVFDTTELRQRIGGKGETEWEKYPAIVPYYSKSIPASWARIDENDPPCFESEAVYLKRLDFLTLAEERYLAKHPELMVGEQVKFEKNED